jgi:hypothetical protein
LAYQLRLVQAARGEGGDWLVRLSPLGRWLLGQGAAPPEPAFPQTLLVQPNLEILVYRQGLSPALVARLSLFAAWKNLGAACTLQLQPETVYRALETGESFETVLGTLERHGMKATPDAVVNALRTWADKRDRIQVFTAGALFEFNSAEDLNEALARGVPAVRLSDRLAIVANESAIDYRHFRLTATRDYALPPEKCVEGRGCCSGPVRKRRCNWSASWCCGRRRPRRQTGCNSGRARGASSRPASARRPWWSRRRTPRNSNAA